MTSFLSRTKPHHAKMELFVIYIVDGGDDERCFSNSSTLKVSSLISSPLIYMLGGRIYVLVKPHSLLSLFSFLQTLVSSSVK